MMATDPTTIGLALVGYLLGGIPFGIVVCKVLGAADPRSAGSRNVGFTNVLRVAGKTAGVLTLLGDLGKGWLVAWAAGRALEHEAAVLVVAVMPILGHIYSPYLGLRGGKGVATALGAILGVAPLIGLAVLGIWLLTAGVTRYSSAGAIAACAAFPVVALASGKGMGFVLFAVAVAAVLLQRHTGNIKRLLEGTEPKLGQRTS